MQNEAHEQTRRIRFSKRAEKAQVQASAQDAEVSQVRRSVVEVKHSAIRVDINATGWRAGLLYFGAAMLLGYVMGVAGCVLGGM